MASYLVANGRSHETPSFLYYLHDRRAVKSVQVACSALTSVRSGAEIRGEGRGGRGEGEGREGREGRESGRTGEGEGWGGEGGGRGRSAVISEFFFSL